MRRRTAAGGKQRRKNDGHEHAHDTQTATPRSRYEAASAFLTAFGPGQFG